MKRFMTLVTLVLLFDVLIINAHDFAPIGAKWYYAHSVDNPGMGSYFVYESVKDTVISGFSLRKIEETRLMGSLLGPEGCFIKGPSFYVTSQADTAYIYNPEKNKLDKLYIFNAQAGDTLQLDVPYYSLFKEDLGDTYRVVIDSVTLYKTGGAEIKKYWNTSLDQMRFWGGAYYDYAGDAMMLFPDGGMLTGYADGPLRCYSDPTLPDTLKFADCACDEHKWVIMPAVEKVKENLHFIELFYSPKEKILSIQSAFSDVDYTVDLFYTGGAKALSFSGSLSSLAGLPQGVYLIQICAGGTVVYESKISVE